MFRIFSKDTYHLYFFFFAFLKRITTKRSSHATKLDVLLFATLRQSCISPLPWKLDNPYCHKLLVSYLSVKVKFRSNIFHFLDGWSNQRRCVQIVDFKQIHQIVSPISNFESTNFLYKYLSWLLLQLAKWEEKNCFGTVRSLFSFSTAQTETNLWKNFVKQIG